MKRFSTLNRFMKGMSFFGIYISIENSDKIQYKLLRMSIIGVGSTLMFSMVRFFLFIIKLLFIYSMIFKYFYKIDVLRNVWLGIVFD